jgi:hypothetical protein
VTHNFDGIFAVAGVQDVEVSDFKLPGQRLPEAVLVINN